MPNLTFLSRVKGITSYRAWILPAPHRLTILNLRAINNVTLLLKFVQVMVSITVHLATFGHMLLVPETNLCCVYSFPGNSLSVNSMIFVTNNTEN